MPASVFHPVIGMAVSVIVDVRVWIILEMETGSVRNHWRRITGPDLGMLPEWLPCVQLDTYPKIRMQDDSTRQYPPGTPDTSLDPKIVVPARIIIDLTIRIIII